MFNDKLLELVRNLLENPCCCRYCEPRIDMFKTLNGKVMEYPGMVISTWGNDNPTFIVLDDPGCYANRYIDGFGTIFTCYGIGGEYAEIEVEVYNTRYERLAIDRLVLRRTGNIQYYYTKNKYDELKTIALPRPREINSIDNLDKLFQPESIITQLLALMLALEFKSKLVLLNTSSFYNVVTRLAEMINGDKVIMIMPENKQLITTVRDSLERDTHINVYYFDCKESCLEELLKSYKYLRSIL